MNAFKPPMALLSCSMCMVITVGLALPARSETARFEFSSPVTGGTDSVLVDLGGPVAQVTSVTFSATGTFVREQWECTYPEGATYPGSSGAWGAAFIENGDQLARTSWELVQDGTFAIEGEVLPYDSATWNSVFADGTVLLMLLCVIDDEEAIGMCAFQNDGSFDLTRAGLIQFTGAPAIQIEYEPAVALQRTAWGTMKATYR